MLFETTVQPKGRRDMDAIPSIKYVNLLVLVLLRQEIGPTILLPLPIVVLAFSFGINSLEQRTRFAVSYP
jgi:hypothetical protein